MGKDFHRKNEERSIFKNKSHRNKEFGFNHHQSKKSKKNLVIFDQVIDQSDNIKKSQIDKLIFDINYDYQ